MKLVGPYEFARIVGRGPQWTRRLLRQWLKEQDAGGPKRVIPKESKRHGVQLYTTTATIAREFPDVADNELKRMVKKLARDVQWLEKQLNQETTARLDLTKRMDALERGTFGRVTRPQVKPSQTPVDNKGNGHA